MKRCCPGPPGYGRLVRAPLDVDGEFNDVRARGSGELEWYIQFAVRWQPARLAPSIRPVSYFAMDSAGPRVRDQQSTMEYYTWIKRDTQYVGWYSGRFTSDGIVLAAKPHFHSFLLQTAFIFKGSPSNIGVTSEYLDEEELARAARDWVPGLVPLAGTAFPDLNAAESHFRSFAPELLRCSYQPSATSGPGPLSCTMDSGAEPPWQFVAGDAFTVVTLLDFTTPSELLPSWTSVPDELPMHTTFFLVVSEGTADDTEGVSCYESFMCTAAGNSYSQSSCHGHNAARNEESCQKGACCGVCSEDDMTAMRTTMLGS